MVEPISIGEYPSLISLPYIAFQQEQIPVKRMEGMLKLFDSTIRFVLCVILCEFFRHEDTNPRLDRVIQKNIQVFDLDNWLDFSVQYIKTVQDSDMLSCGQLHSFLFAKDGNNSVCHEIIKEFLKLQKESMEKDFHLILNQEILGHFELRLSQLIGSLGFFKDLELVQIIQDGLTKKIIPLDFNIFRTAENGNTVGMDVLDPGNVGKVFLKRKDSQDFFPLHPFLILASCKQCFQPHLFFFEEINSKTFKYIDPLEGHEQEFQDIDLMLRLGNLLARKKFYRDANKLYQQAHVLDPDSKETKDLLFITYKLMGTQYMFEKKYHKAIINLTKALDLHPDNTTIPLNLSKAFYCLNEFDEAIKSLKSITRISPREPEPYQLLGRIYEKKNMPQRAVVFFNKYLELVPTDKETVKRRNACAREVRESEFKQKYSKPGKEETETHLNINKFVKDITKEARQGEIPSIVGRKTELEAIIEILSCHEKNNPIIIGEPGVGKTALVGELANCIVKGNIPSNLVNKRILQVNVAAILAGTKYRGQFEQRMLDLIKELKLIDNSIIFIDDLHTIMHAGGSKGGGLDISNILKPALSRGEIQCIGITTLDEYRLYIEKDPAFERRFQVVKLEEPSDEETYKILRNMKNELEKFHEVVFPDEVVKTAVHLPRLFLRDRFLPDKAIDILDRAGARANLRIMAQDEQSGTQTEPSLRMLRKEDVMSVVSDLSGVPLMESMSRKQERFTHMESILNKRIIGQDEAVETVSKVLRTTKLGFHMKPERPDGIFLFMGPTGVGKTELARALAEFLFGTEERLVRIDMSEFTDQISSSKLIGISPGYVGYHDRNQLGDEIRNHPFSLILLDEIEKANNQVLNLFLQVFDAGKLTDGKGRAVYFGNTTIIMTSNIGGELYQRVRVGYGIENADGNTNKTEQVTKSTLLREIKRYLSPEFINRIDEIVFFNTLSPADVKKIALLNMKLIMENLQKSGKQLVIDDSALDLIVREGYSKEFGARNLDRIIRRRILDPLAQKCLVSGWDEIRVIRILAIQEDIIIQME